MNITAGNYNVEFIKISNTVIFSGTLRLQGKEEYEKIYDLLLTAAKDSAGGITIDMRTLEFLNSSGISSLSLFMIEMRNLEKEIKILGSNTVSWQVKSLTNFQRLYHKVQIVFE